MKILKRAGTVVLSVILWAIILIAALYAFTTMATRDNQNVANIFGYTPLTVQSDSMVPTFAAGDLIFIKKCDPATLEEGDIICFHTIIDNEYALNTHRIESIESVGDARSYTTIGDNNNGITDQHVISDGDIVGKYVGHLAGFGKVMDFLSSSMGFLIVIILPMMLFFIYQIYHLITISIRLKRALAVENARAAEMARMEAAQRMMPQQPQMRQPMPPQEMPGVGAGKVNPEAAAARSEAEQALAEAKRIREEAEAIRAKAEAEQALAEAKRMKEEAEAIRARAQAELEKAKGEKSDGEDAKQ